MKARSWLKYLGYLLLFIGVIWLKSVAESVFQMDYSTTYKFNHLLYAVIILTTVIAGALLGLESLLKELKKEGRWRVNLPKIILLIIPSLICSLFYIIAMIDNNITGIILYPIYNFFGMSDSFVTIFQITLGYSLITFMYKETVKEPEGAVENNGYLCEGTNEEGNGSFGAENYEEVSNLAQETDLEADKAEGAEEDTQNNAF